MFHDRDQTRLRRGVAAKRFIGVVLLSLLLAQLLIACAGSSTDSASVDQAGQSTTAESAAQDVEIPVTPAGRHIDAWLTAFNSGDQAQLQRFFEEHLVPSDDFPPGPMAARMADIYKQSGSITLHSIEEATETEVSFVVQQQLTESWVRFTFILEGQAPHRIAEMVPPTQIDAPSGAVAGEKLNDEELRKRVEDYLQKLAQDDAFWGTVLIARDGEPLVNQAYGMANQETQTLNSVNTVYPLVSLGKMFTTIAIGQLMEQGRLRLDDPLSAYVPDVPKEIADKVQLRHLLNHRSGIPDFFFSNPERYGELFDSSNPHSDFIQIIADQPLDFEPGSKYEYSNSNFLLLGALIERVSGENYYDYVREHIFEPAGMGETFWDPQTVDPGRLARPHSVFGPDGTPTAGQRYIQPATGMLLPSGHSHPPAGGAWGGGYATASDMLKFFTALRQHTLLGEEYTNLLFTGSADGQSTNGDQSYGFHNESIRGKSLIGYAGGAPGIVNHAYMYPGGYDVIILTNGDTPPAGIVDLLKDLLLR